MPVIPTSDSFVRQTPNLRTAVSTPDYTPLAKADQQIGEAYGDLGKGISILEKGIEKKKLENDTFEYQLAKSKALQDSITLEDQIKNTPDYKTIPKEHSEGWSQIKSDALSQVANPKLRQKLGVELDIQAEKDRIGADTIFRHKEGDAGRGKLMSTLDTNQKSLLSTSNEATKNEILTTTSQLIEGAKAKGWINSEQATKVRIDFLEGYANNRISSMNEDQQIAALGVKRGKNGELTFAQTKTFADFLSPERKITIYNQAKSQIDARNKTVIREEINDVEQAARLGLVVPTEKIKSLASRAGGAGMPEVANNLYRYAAVQDQTNVFATKSINQQKQELAQVRIGVEKGNIKDVDKYAAFSNVLENKVKLLKDDPYSYYEAHGIVNTPQPLNISDANSIAQNLQSRRIEAEKVRKIEGNDFALPLFTKDEIGQLKSIYVNKSPADTAKVIANIGNQLTQPEKIALSRQLATDDDKNTILATAMALPTKQASDLLIGNSIKGEVKPSRVRESLAARMKGFIFNPETNENIQKSVFATYKKLAFDAGNIDAEVDEEILDKSIQQVVGKPVEISIKGNTSKVFTYLGDDGKFVDDDDLEDTFRSINNDVLTKLNGSLPLLVSGDYVDAKDILKDTRMVSQGNGIYAPYYDGLGYLVKPDGKIYTIDARKVKQITGNAPKEKGFFGKVLDAINPISDANSAEPTMADKEQLIRDRYKQAEPIIHYQPSEEEVKRFAKGVK